MIDAIHYPPSRKYDVNEEYADAERALSEAWLDLYAARHAALHGRAIPKPHATPTLLPTYTECDHEWIPMIGQRYVEICTRCCVYQRTIRERAEENISPIDDDLHTAPPWQTDPPTEEGWYRAIREGYRVVVKVVWYRGVQGGKRLVPNGPFDFDAFTHWWPIPITMPEPPEGM